MGVYGFEDSKDKAYLTDIFKSTKVTVNIDYQAAAGPGIFTRWLSLGVHEGYKPILAYGETRNGGESGCAFYITGVTMGHVTDNIPGAPARVNLAILYTKEATPGTGHIEKEIEIIWARKGIVGTF